MMITPGYALAPSKALETWAGQSSIHPTGGGVYLLRHGSRPLWLRGTVVPNLPMRGFYQGTGFKSLKMEAGRSNGRKYECLLFDMDDTLYPLSLGINVACRRNIEEYMLNHLHIEESEVPRLCLELYKEYGTTMAGLKLLGYEFDNDEFHAYVHGRLPYELLKPDLVLRNLLHSMPQQKIIFTNADEAHVGQVLSRLGLEDCFHGVICFETLNPCIDKELPEEAPEMKNENLSLKTQILCKPSLEAMEAAIRIANVDPKKTIFFDDSVRNIASGKAAGLNTVIVGRSTLVTGADHALNSIHNIKEALPEIWED